MKKNDYHEIYEKLKRVYEEMGLKAPFPSYEEMYGSDDTTAEETLSRAEPNNPPSVSKDNKEPE